MVSVLSFANVDVFQSGVLERTRKKGEYEMDDIDLDEAYQRIIRVYMYDCRLTSVTTEYNSCDASSTVWWTALSTDDIAIVLQPG